MFGIMFKSDYVECETCGCLLRKSTAKRGESKIVTVYDISHSCVWPPPSREEIKKTYYCKIHNNKKN